MERINTGIRNLDKLLGGGIPKKETVLIKGEPGAGKSNLGLEYLYRGAQKGQSGLYVSFQETEDRILRSNTFDWEFDKYVEDGSINITKFDPYRYEQIAEMLRGIVKDNNAERVVLDPITDLDLYIESRKDIRKNLLTIKNSMADLNATTLLMAENEEATEVEEEVVDGILNMEVKRQGGRVMREIYVKKLRGSDYNQGVHNYIFRNDGITIQ